MIKDANDLKTIDFEFDGASVFEALGKLQNYLGQMFAQNMAVQVQNKMVEFYRDSMPKDLTEAEEFMRKTVPPHTWRRLNARNLCRVSSKLYG